MNDWDYDNLQFLLSCNQKEFGEFVESLYDQEDLNYAINLVQRGISLLKVEMMESTDDVDDVSLALEVISKVKG